MDERRLDCRRVRLLVLAAALLGGWIAIAIGPRLGSTASRGPRSSPTTTAINRAMKRMDEPFAELPKVWRTIGTLPSATRQR